jgi:lipopolysaccharide export LptBFGC system permease protein LptF
MITFVLKRASGTSVAAIVVPFFAIAFVVAATA